MNTATKMIFGTLLSIAGGNLLAKDNEKTPEFSCSIQYIDSALQPTPLFNENFEASLNGEQGVVRPFGFAPIPGYFAAVSKNNGATEDSKIVLMIANTQTNANAISLFAVSARQLHLQINTSSSQMLSLTCARR